jgi:osmotically-inducible protein OsmY
MIRSASPIGALADCAVVGPSAPRCTTPTPAAASKAASIVELAQRRLRESSYCVRNISCAYDEGVLTLRGHVHSFYLKQIVQALAEKVDGVRQVVNLVDVVDPGPVR